MWNSKDIYYISDSTGILINTLGQALLCQFPEISFHEEKFPYVRTVKDAERTLAYIREQSTGRQPIIFSTIMDPDVRNVFKQSEIDFFDTFEFFLEPLEDCLEARALRVPGFSRQRAYSDMSKRVDAIHYCLDHDDGIKVEEFDDADVILLGVSRAGKTPVSVYLGTQMGLKAANYPLTTDDFKEFDLPDKIKRYKKRAIGLTTSPELLHSIREKRYTSSKYAKLTTCIEEIEQAEAIYHRNHIPIVSTAGKSIEEIATEISQELGLAKKSGNLTK